MFADYYMTINDVADQLGKSRHTVMEWVRRKDAPLPSYLPPDSKQGRVVRFSELAEWIEREGRV